MTGNWKVELEDASLARLSGNEGRARVCARRAAGIAARDFLTRRGVRLRTLSAYDALRALEQFPGLPSDLKSAAAHLTLRVTEAFTLPTDIDLLADARLLCDNLFWG
ncbi:MAG: hypothetical protein HY781_06665 [Chloroflexi bacterium]|nr:hypothetical protein [Chloroflexota bacterium]